VMALSFGGYLAGSLGNAVSPVVIAIATVVALSLINYVGVKDSARLSAILTVIKLLVLAVFVLVGVFFIRPENYVPFVPNGWGSVLVGSAFIFFAYTGFARVTTLGEEVRDPKRTIPKVILSSVLISMVVYLVVMVVLIGMTSYGNVAGSSSPLATAIIAATHDRLLGAVIAIGAMFATINVALMMVLGLSRVIFAMARNGDLPRVFSRLSRFGTPGYAILFTSAVMVAAILATSYRQIVAISNAGSLLSYIVINGALFALLLKKPGVFGRRLYSRSYFKAVPVAGMALALILMSFLTRLSLALIAVVLVLITAYYLFLRSRGRG
ncbi:MAG: amino acid permease, partial [Candidatus Micrarchaeota archaeon]|nr:amino acid permease [Candidatus Micrarchaeota archaeon]